MGVIGFSNGTGSTVLLLLVEDRVGSMNSQVMDSGASLPDICGDWTECSSMEQDGLND